MQTKDHKQNVYYSVDAMCHAYNIEPATYKYRKEKGWTTKEALTTPLYKRLTAHSPKPVTDHLGNTFSSAYKMYQHYNISSALYEARRQKGWPIEKALLTPPLTKGYTGQAVTDHKGNHFTSKKAMCHFYGINPSALSQKAKRGYKLCDILEPKKRYPYDDGLGHKFKTLHAFAKHYNVNIMELSNALKAGKTIQDLVHASKDDRRQKTYKDHLGNSYSCLDDLVSVYDIPKNVYYYRKRKNWSIKAILTTPVNQSKHRKIFKDHHGNEYFGLKPLLDTYHLSRSVYDYRIKAGWSIEKTLTTPVSHKKRKLS